LLKIFRGGRPVEVPTPTPPVRGRPLLVDPPPIGPDVFDGWPLMQT